MKWTIRLSLAGCLLAWASPATAQLDERKLLDLTYPFDERTVYWPTNKPFQWEKTDWGMTAGGYWYASANFATSEHGGTHIDAPIHFGKGPSAGDEILVQPLGGAAGGGGVTPGGGLGWGYRRTPPGPQ